MVRAVILRSNIFKKPQLYRHLLLISQTMKVRRTRHAAGEVKTKPSVMILNILRSIDISFQPTSKNVYEFEKYGH